MSYPADYIHPLVRRLVTTNSTRGQIARFLLVGGTSMLVDLATYRTCLAILGVVSLAKASGFIVGTTFAFFANRMFTFKQETNQRGQVSRFLTVYSATLLVNVALNGLLLGLLGLNEFGIMTSFLVATVFSSALNFIGMKRYVFKAIKLP